MSNTNTLATHNPVQSPRKRAHKVEDSIYVKRGTSQQVRREVEAMDFVRRHTSIPIPSVFEIHVNENDTNPSSWFSMSATPGCPLTDAWSSMNEKARRATQTDLRNFLHELRAVPPLAPVFIGSCNGGPAYDRRLNNGYPLLQSRILMISSWALWPDVLGKSLSITIADNLQIDHGVAFTHADLCGEHIFVETTTGRITGFIDWEMAGWWPAYWEYTKSQFGNRHQTWWKLLIANVLHPHQHELRIEDLQQARATGPL